MSAAPRHLAYVVTPSFCNAPNFRACKQPHPVLFVVVRRVPADAATVRFAGCCSPHRTAVVRRKKEPSKPWLPVFIQSDPRPASRPSRSKELTFKFSGPAAGLFGDSFPFLGYGSVCSKALVWMLIMEFGRGRTCALRIGASFGSTRLIGASFGSTRLMCASFGSTSLIRASFGSTRLICASFGSTRLICASFGSTRLMCASFGSTRLICASFGSTRLICAFYGTTRLLCKGTARGRPTRGRKDA
ncbi:NAC-alpha domain-containing protein 1 [Cucumis melo var. makuwa]|uniref:NAC-alpha domain-containing protein 1 n=1 Tax=Cucumis melo var. makuwa TaxID=1194695 RepID=A0A5A7UTA9_CUCMM|nr:NAC-alpha domain-containing protein 1 [Cucumis melo var. makuwa]